MQMVSGHRAFQTEGKASAKALRKECVCVWCVSGGSKSPDWGGMKESKSNRSHQRGSREPCRSVEIFRI